MARAEPTIRLLLVDDDELLCLALGDLLESEGVEVVIANSLAEARERDPSGFDLVLVDDRLPDGRGLTLFDGRSHARMVLISGAPEIDTAIAALRQHALDYLCKPIDLDRLRSLVAEVQAETLRARAQPELDRSVEHEPKIELVGSSVATRALRTALEQAASSRASLLLTGETGTGKSLAARWLHGRSPRASGPFVALNCASLPETLVESELFGSERGAYTGAFARRQGLIEAASGGILFLDEIGELPLAAQAKLLDVLETGQVRRLGATRSHRIDFQLVAATNVELELACAQGRFRSDLLFRIDVLRIEVPPLRERGEDLELLIPWLLRAQGNPDRSLAPGELERLREHAWPGNIRELRNLLERACVLAPQGRLEPSRWLANRSQRSSPCPATRPSQAPARVDDLVMRHMIEIVERSSSRKQAAAALGIGESTLRRKLKQAEQMGLWSPESSERSGLRA